MKIYAVLVDDLPEKCTSCQFVKLQPMLTKPPRDFGFCVVLHEAINLVNYADARQPDCPLVKVRDWIAEHLDEMVRGRDGCSG